MQHGYEMSLCRPTRTKEVETWVGVIGNGGNFSSSEITTFPPIDMTTYQHP